MFNIVFKKSFMKTRYTLMLIAAFSFLTKSCTKKEDENKKASVFNSNCLLISKQVGSAKMVYDYFDKGNIKTISGFYTGSTDPDVVYSYTYNANTITYTNESGREKGTITLNDKGNAVSHDITYYSGQDPTQATSMKSEEHTYDASGYLIKMSRTISSSSGTTSSSRIYEWKNGNLYSTKLVSNAGDTTSKEVYTYYIDKMNAFADFDSKTKFTGFQSNNLLKEIIDHSSATPEVIATYSYQFDEKGFPTKTVMNSMGNVTEEMYTFRCGN